MKLIVTPDAESATRAAADLLVNIVCKNPDVVLGLATGRTMEGVYADIAKQHRNDGMSFAGITSFNLDEYVGLPSSDARSYRHYMQAHLFDHVNAKPGNIHVPNGVAPDLEAECQAYETSIRAAGGIALQLLGIGDTGHIGFNEPPSPFDTRTRVIELDEATRSQNAAMFGGDPNNVPKEAITMGVGTILDADSLLMVAIGPAKAAIVAAALEGPITADVSASAIRLHPDVTVVLDEASAAALSPETRALARAG